MGIPQTLVIATLAAASFLAGLLCFYLFERARDSRSATYLAYLMMAAALWSGLNAFEYIVGSLAAKLVLADLQYVAIAAIPVLWYSFGSSLRREEFLGVGRDPRPLIWIVPAITILLAWLDPFLGLLRHSFRLEEQAGFTMIAKEFGPWFWVHSAYSYLWIIAGTVLVFRSIGGGGGASRAQVLTLAAGTILPTAANALYVTGLFPLRSVDPTPLAFALTGLLLVVNLTRLRFLSLLTAARASAIERIRDPILILSREGSLAAANAAAREAFGIGALDPGKPLAALSGPAARLAALPPGEGELTEAGRHYETRVAEIAGSGRSIGRLVTLHDVTRRVAAEEALREANRGLEERIAERTRDLEETASRLEEELEHRARNERRFFHDALHDPLTGLANRSQLASRIEQTLGRCRRDPTVGLGLVYLGLDGFRAVNEAHGLEGGDALLREAGRRLKAAVRDLDTVCRIGGDEFVILLDGIEGEAEANEIVDRVNDGLSVPLSLEGGTVLPSAAAGILVAPGGAGQPEDALRDAETAMRAAKAAGRGQRRVFREEMRRDRSTRGRLEGDLRAALASGGITVAYQPIVRMDGSPAGCEALARWSHPEHGNVGPDRFIPIAEESGLIVPLGTLVLLEALRAAKALRDAGLPVGTEDFFVAVNVSAIQLSQPDFAQLVLDSVSRHALPRSALHLELTESAFMENRERVVATVGLLAAEGVGVKLDDFGTGYSSLGQLHRMPVDTVKIDRSFVEGMCAEPGAGGARGGMVRGIISLAHELGKTVVAEGVETGEQAALLGAFGCDFCQGWLYGRPSPDMSLCLGPGRPGGQGASQGSAR